MAKIGFQLIFDNGRMLQLALSVSCSNFLREALFSGSRRFSTTLLRERSLVFHRLSQTTCVTFPFYSLSYLIFLALVSFWTSPFVFFLLLCDFYGYVISMHPSPSLFLFLFLLIRFSPLRFHFLFRTNLKGVAFRPWLKKNKSHSYNKIHFSIFFFSFLSFFHSPSIWVLFGVAKNLGPFTP